MDTDFSTNVLTKITTLSTTGRSYRRVKHSINDVVQGYIASMKIAHNSLGNAYLSILENDIQTIFSKILAKNNYEALEFCNNVIDWYFKCLAFKYNLTKNVPKLPDYIIAEIRDIAKSLE